eukprot:3643301-Prymnesium_polylepis.1
MSRSGLVFGPGDVPDLLSPDPADGPSTPSYGGARRGSIILHRPHRPCRGGPLMGYPWDTQSKLWRYLLNALRGPR